MDIEEGFSPIERAATMSSACENRAAFRFPRRKTEPDHQRERGKIILYGQNVIVCFTPHWL
jgi:hypothetical protein